MQQCDFTMQQVRDSTVDVMRLSIIVRNNLEKEAEAKEYDAASSAGASKGDVKLHHTDAELDFEEQAAEPAGVCSCCYNLLFMYPVDMAWMSHFAARQHRWLLQACCNALNPDQCFMDMTCAWCELLPGV